MGCCNSVMKIDSSVIDIKIAECVSSGTLKHLSYFISVKSQSQTDGFDVNSSLFPYVECKSVNILALAFIYGRLDLVKYLHESLNASFDEMEKSLQKIGLSGMKLIFTNNFLELFEYYAPIYLNTKSNNPKSQKSKPINETLVFEKPEKSENPQKVSEENLTLIQQACIKGNIMMIKAASDLCKTLKRTPKQFDIHYIEKKSGLNCALLACKFGNYNMIKFLHSQHQANFDLLNISGENCIQIMAAQAIKFRLLDFYQCLVYLIDTVKVNIKYNYEESLILLNAMVASEYFIKKLKEIGVFVDEEYLVKEIISTGKVNKNPQSTNEVETSLTVMLSDLKTEEISEILHSSGSSHESFMQLGLVS